ncbi:MAG: prolyl oligopeptidase family serine peptidase [Planctomycetaceae bacterium]
MKNSTGNASAIFLTAALLIAWTSSVSADELPKQSPATTVSELDGEKQPILYWAPESASREATPLFIFLHSWSADYTQDNSKWMVECVRRNWIWLHPNFRGINHTPKACGSKFARQDILDAVRFAREKWKVDHTRVYIAGVSGGGHMSLLMAGHHPEQFSAVSAWVGPLDLIEWHRFHTVDGKPDKYAQMIELSLGGPPGISKEVDAEYRDRSPVFNLSRTGDLPISILAGVQDGHTGSVPVSHSLLAFNEIARAQEATLISDEEIQSLVKDRKLQNPLPSDTVDDPILGRRIHLQRSSRTAVVTIFEGGHESIPESAFSWLEKQQRATQTPKK